MTDSVTAFSQSHPDPEMDVIGRLIALGILVLLLPALPFFALLWLLGRAGEKLGRPTAGPSSLRAFERERERESR